MVRTTVTRALGLLLAAPLALAPAAAAPGVSPPALIAPMIAATAPVLFQWTPVAPVNVYRLHVHGGTRAAAATSTIVAVSYEVQISDRPDVGSHVLFDRTVDATTLLFDNRNVDGSGFTDQQMPGTPLAGGTYYWRVRALFAGPSSPYSSIGRFAFVGGGATSTPLHDLGVTSVQLGANPIAGIATPVVVHVADLGTFPETGASVAISANGRVIGRAAIPQLLPGRGVDVSVMWEPDGGGLAQVSAQLEYDDQNAVDNQIAQTTFVATRKPVRTTLVGTLVARQGGYAIADRGGNHVAALEIEDGAHVDFASLVGSRVAATGGLRAHGSDLVLAVRSIAAAAR